MTNLPIAIACKRTVWPVEILLSSSGTTTAVACLLALSGVQLRIDARLPARGRRSATGRGALPTRLQARVLGNISTRSPIDSFEVRST
jgi:hypothetical protein